MTEPVPEERPHESTVEPGDDHDPAPMPRWIPVLIGVLLVVLAGLAVYTGLHYRNDDSLTSKVPPRRDRSTTPAPPGEPGAGASLVLHGESGENTPTASAPVTGDARAVISGGTQGVTSTVRIWARRGMVMNVLPEDSMVYVNDLPIGQVSQFNTLDEVYDFAEPGSYTVKIVSPKGEEKTFIVTAGNDAKQEIARISVKF
jgi:hypothetical protein